MQVTTADAAVAHFDQDLADFLSKPFEPGALFERLAAFYPQRDDACEHFLRICAKGKKVQEAVHGDLGMLGAGDIVLALSYSGETEELLRLLPTLKRLNAKLIAVSGCSNSTLAQASDIFLDAELELLFGVIAEANDGELLGAEGQLLGVAQFTDVDVYLYDLGPRSG